MTIACAAPRVAKPTPKASAIGRPRRIRACVPVALAASATINVRIGDPLYELPRRLTSAPVADFAKLSRKIRRVLACSAQKAGSAALHARRAEKSAPATRVRRTLAEPSTERMIEVGEVAKARHRGDVADSQVARQRIAQHLMGAFQPQLADIAGKRDASALQELLHIALRQSEPPPDRRSAKAGIDKPPRDVLNNRLEPRCFDAAIDSGASEIALGVEHIRQQF